MSTQDNTGSSEDNNLPALNPHSLAQIQANSKVDIIKLLKLNAQVPPLTLAEKGKILGCTKVHVKEIQDMLDIIQGRVEHFKANKADIYDNAIERIQAIHLTDARIKRATFRDALVAIGILDDKAYRARQGGNTDVQGLERIFKGLHIDMKAGTIDIGTVSPFKESPKGMATTSQSDSDTIDIPVVIEDIPSEGESVDDGVSND